MNRPSSARVTAALVLAVIACGLSVCASPARAAISGDQLWSRVYGGRGGDVDKPLALALAPGGKHVYVAGYVTPAPGAKSDVCLVKYTAGGTRVWVRTWGGTTGDTDQAVDVVCDATGNVYVGGVTTKASGFDFLCLKYSASGVRRWVRTWNGPGNDDDLLRDLALDADGNVYAAGGAYAAATGTDPALVKWTPAGKRAWVQTYPSAGADAYECVVVDKARKRVFAAGSDAVASRNDWLVVRYGTGGKQVWDRPVGDPNTYYHPTSMALTPDGAVIVAGSGDTGVATTSDGCICRWTAAGDFVWSASFAGSAGDRDVIEDVAVDGDGNVVAVGTAKQDLGESDGFLVTWRPDGSERGSMYIGGDVYDDVLTEVAVDRAGNVYAAGATGVSVGGTQFWVHKFSAGLVWRWTRVKDLKGIVSADHPTDLVVRTGTYPGLYVTGVALNTTSWDCLTVKYKP